MSTRYYLVGEDSPVMAVIQESVKKNAEFQAAMRELAKELGTPDIYIRNQTFVGVGFKKAPPEGWRRTKNGYYVPNKRSAAGRLLAARFDALPSGVDSFRFSQMLHAATKASYMHCDGNRVMWAGYYKGDKGYVLAVPLGCKAAPPMCEEILPSQFLEMRKSA